MGVALLTGALLMFLTNMRWIPGGGTAIGFCGHRAGRRHRGQLRRSARSTRSASAATRPSLIVFSLMGMDPRSAFPIMMGSAAYMLPMAGIKFARANCYDGQAALGIALGGIPGRAGRRLRGQEPAARSDPLARGSGGAVCRPLAAAHRPRPPRRGAGGRWASTPREGTPPRLRRLIAALAAGPDRRLRRPGSAAPAAASAVAATAAATAARPRRARRRRAAGARARPAHRSAPRSPTSFAPRSAPRRWRRRPRWPPTRPRPRVPTRSATARTATPRARTGHEASASPRTPSCAGRSRASARSRRWWCRR